MVAYDQLVRLNGEICRLHVPHKVSGKLVGLLSVLLRHIFADHLFHLP